MKDNKILITGGAGFYGSHIAAKAIKDGYDVVIIDILNSETTPRESKEINIKNLIKLGEIHNSPIKFYESDITNESEMNSIFQNEQPTILVHAAAEAMDRRSIEYPLEFIHNNVYGSQVIINACYCAQNLQKVIFISTRSAIGEVRGASSFIKEDDNFKPVNPYGASKAAAEGFFYSYHNDCRIPLKICRMQPMYGPKCRHDMFPWRILNSILTGETIEKYGDGNGVRDWLYIDDAVDAIFSILDETSAFEIFNIGTGIGTSTNELIDICTKITGKQPDIKDVPVIRGDAYFAGLADCEKIKSKTGWAAKINLYEGIKLTYDHMINNQ
jgi:nucleoside-diphosphate-sugar epimerase